MSKRFASAGVCVVSLAELVALADAPGRVNRGPTVPKNEMPPPLRVVGCKPPTRSGQGLQSFDTRPLSVG